MRRTHSFAHAVLATAAIAVAASPAAAGAFLDRTDWVANTDEVVSPDYTPFANSTFEDGVPFDLGGDFTVTAQGGDATLNQVPNFIFGFAVGGLSSVTFEFPAPITGFAAIWSNTFVEAGFTVSSPFNDYNLNELSDPLDAQFIGFTEDMPFTTVTFTPTNDPATDFVFFRDFEFAFVPAPGSPALLLCSAGLFARRRR